MIIGMRSIGRIYNISSMLPVGYEYNGNSVMDKPIIIIVMFDLLFFGFDITIYLPSTRTRKGLHQRNPSLIFLKRRASSLLVKPSQCSGSNHFINQ